jgi:quercetin dioxygenase-like cupin family protein
MSASNPTDDRPPQPGQVSNLPGLTTYITGHDPSTGKSIVQSTRPGNWTAYDDKLMGFNVAYTTSSFPASLASDADLAAHDNLMKSQTLGLVNPGGTVCRIVDSAPGYECIMHRTQSLDYGIVLEGTIEMILDSGERKLMRRGDVAVQRATMHAWKNVSETEWARMLFVLQDCAEVSVGGQVLKEDLGKGIEGLPSSENNK